MAPQENVKITESGNFLIIDREGDSPAYFLPWKADKGYYIDLPANPGEKKLFFTAELTGCCVGVQRMPEGVVRVCHYNVQDAEFTLEDLQRYNNDQSVRRWLLPDKYDTPKNANIRNSGAKFYGGYFMDRNPTCFWGEFEDNQWKFYYQAPKPESYRSKTRQDETPQDEILRLQILSCKILPCETHHFDY